MLKIELKDGEQKVFFKSGGEWCYLWTPPGYNQDKSVPLVIHHHGARGYVREGEADWIDTPLKKGISRRGDEGRRLCDSGKPRMWRPLGK